MAKVRPGLEVLIGEQLDLVKGKRVGLITNHSAVTSDTTHILDALLAAGVNVTALFAPEHGIRGDIADGDAVHSGKDSRTGITEFSIYGGEARPTPEMLDEVDVLIDDLQDIGGRYYTFTYTMSRCMKAASERGKQFIVLDRPNPVNGVTVDGQVMEQECTSFIGQHEIPDRPGMTIGELARLFNDTLGYGADLTVVPCKGWSRDMWWDETGLPWVVPSPNIPTPDSALAFTITCLIEGTNLSEGRGITRPFEIVGAPFVDPFNLADTLNSAGLPGVRFRPAHFIPHTSKHAKTPCKGVHIHFMDRDAVETVRTGLHVVKALYDQNPGEFKFRDPDSSGINHFDKVAGSVRTQKAIEAGTPADEIYASYMDGLEAFKRLREKYLIY